MSNAFIDYVLELFGPFGTVSSRRMFGGHGIYLDGLMFAIVTGDVLYLKADKMNMGEFEQAGCDKFAYMRKGRRTALNFYQAPSDAMEAPEFMLPWARSAYAAALRTNASKLAAAQGRAQVKPRTSAAKPLAKPLSKRTTNKQPARKKKLPRRSAPG